MMAMTWQTQRFAGFVGLASLCFLGACSGPAPADGEEPAPAESVDEVSSPMSEAESDLSAKATCPKNRVYVQYCKATSGSDKGGTVCRLKAGCTYNKSTDFKECRADVKAICGKAAEFLVLEDSKGNVLELDEIP